MPKTQSFNKMLCNGGWNEGPDLVTDSNGWITSLLNNQSAGSYLFNQVNGNYPGGEYVLLWEGDGTFRISDVTISKASNCITRKELDEAQKESGVFIYDFLKTEEAKEIYKKAYN